MRIGYVVKRYPRYSETFIVNEILAHEAEGVPVEIFSLRPPADTHFQDAISRVKAPVTYLTASGKASDLWNALHAVVSVAPDLWRRLPQIDEQDARVVHQAVQLATYAARHELTHLHAHFASSATSVARLASLLTGIPYSFTAHAKDIFHESVEPSDLDRKLRDARVVVTVSDFNRSFLSEHYGESASNVLRVYNGLDLSVFTFDPPVSRRPRILAVGRLVEKKGFDDLVRACAVLARMGRSFECRIIGSGEQESELRTLIRQLDIGASVEMVGPLPQREIIREIRKAAVFAAPCVVAGDGNRDGLPTVLLEAMALGTPCVSTDVTGIPEVLIDNETGLQIPQRDPAALAFSIQRLLKDAALGVRLAENARALIEREFDIEKNAAQIRSILEANVSEVEQSVERTYQLAEAS